MMKAIFKKNALWALAVIAAVLFTACGKDDPEVEIIEDLPGSIAGLGANEGELTGTPFQLPQGIELAYKIMGGYSSDNYRSSGIADKAALLGNLETVTTMVIPTRAGDETVQVDTIIGSGTYVRIFIALRNKTSAPITATFPAGLIAKSVSATCQNGVLLKKTSVRIPTGGIYGVLLLMYCGNAHRSASYFSEEYVFTVISNSSLIVDLCQRLKNKRINIEEYSDSESEQYNTYKSNLQSMLWDLTDYGEPLSEENIALIEQMENR